MKIFLSLDGIVYILGLSHDIVTKLIDVKYRETGVEGKQYIKKIIQIPITLPKWDNKDITKLIQDFIDKNLIHKDYKDIIDLDLISTTVENNPREVKRFINNFIIAYEIFHSIENFKPNELLLIQAIQLRWNEFYNLLMTYGEKKFLRELEKYAQMNNVTRASTLESKETKEEDEEDVLRIRGLLSNHKDDSELWKFLTKNSHILNGIVNLTTYRRAIEVGVEPTAINLYAIDLLRSGKIELFNSRVKDFGILDLSGVDFEGANLVNAKLVNAKLGGADLGETNLAGANLAGANLAWANFSNANLTDANLEGSLFRGTRLINTNLERARVIRADLINAILNGANLRGTDFSGSSITNPGYDETTKLSSDTNFSGASIDDPDFINFLSRFTNHGPKKGDSKESRSQL